MLMRMMADSFFENKRILVIDQSFKDTNDRTWCFWETQPGFFEQIVHHRWENLRFFSADYTDTIRIQPYQYKMIRGIDLYEKVSRATSTRSNIEWRFEKVMAIENEPGKVRVRTDLFEYTGLYVFNSIHFTENGLPAKIDKKGNHFLLQHFAGWVIETDTDCFDPGTATFMDFRVSQEAGTTFVYVLPTSARTALVEYTLFSESLLAREAYEAALKDYIGRYLAVTDYTIQHREFGVIPMTNQSFPLQNGRIIQIGIAGGQAKGSSGYAFRFIQKQAAAIVENLRSGGSMRNRLSLADRKFRFYDGVLLRVLQSGRMSGADIFARIFEKNPPGRVLRFLDNETGWVDDLLIMRSVPTRIFLPAALQQLFSW
ncbi:MAG: lycopene cyclase [Bacteroidota bacterium]|nr:lycopene cyclase [Bacteroidota bacterium]